MHRGSRRAINDKDNCHKSCTAAHCNSLNELVRMKVFKAAVLVALIVGISCQTDEQEECVEGLLETASSAPGNIPPETVALLIGVVNDCTDLLDLDGEESRVRLSINFGNRHDFIIIMQSQSIFRDVCDNNGTDCYDSFRDFLLLCELDLNDGR